MADPINHVLYRQISFNKLLWKYFHVSSIPSYAFYDRRERTAKKYAGMIVVVKASENGQL